MSETVRIGIVLGSTRPSRKSEAVAAWVRERAASRTDAVVETIDLLDHPLPHLDAVAPAMIARGEYQDEATRGWAAAIAPFDGYVFVTPEYNHGAPGVLKNAMDHLYVEWNDKAAGFVSYGVAGGVRAVEQLRLMCGALQMADVAPQVALPLATAFENYAVFRPGDAETAALDALLNHVVAWSRALATLRAAV